ncbi:MAG: hypothetical protein IJK89_04650 [Clostridia bacterium]|nr:hypothetical protein [Clostridia bacterium]
MKRFFSRIFAVGLISALLLGVFSFGGAFAAQSGADDNSLNGKNWMSGIPDGRYLCEINLPGTHDSATAYCKNSTGNEVMLFGRSVFKSGEYAKTQSLTLAEQLNAGVRYLDLRFSAKQGELFLCHGNNEKVAAVNKILGVLRFFDPVSVLSKRAKTSFPDVDTEFYAYEDEACTVPLTGDSVFGQIKAFLQENPSETLIITAKKENGDTEAFLQLFKAQIETLKTEINPSTGQAYLYTENGNGVYTKMPTLSEARGKIILMTPFYEEVQAGDMLDAKNGAGETDFMGMTFHYENHWSVPSYLKTKYAECFLKEFSTEMSKDPEQHLTTANVLKTNASVVLIQNPHTIAQRVSDSLYSQNKLTKGRYYGWIMGDFMTEEICSAIWRTNYFGFEL